MKKMTKKMAGNLFFALSLTMASHAAFAEEAAPPAETASAPAPADGDANLDEVAKTEESAPNQSKWNDTLKSRYKLTDAQIQSLRTKGFTAPQMAMAGGLAEKSGKSLDEVVALRESGKGWGAIAKELGVPPKEIGQSVRETRHAVRDERKADRKENRRENRKEQREEMRAERKQERQDARRARKEARKELREKRRVGKGN